MCKKITQCQDSSQGDLLGGSVVTAPAPLFRFGGVGWLALGSGLGGGGRVGLVLCKIIMSSHHWQILSDTNIILNERVLPLGEVF